MFGVLCKLMGLQVIIRRDKVNFSQWWIEFRRRGRTRRYVHTETHGWYTETGTKVFLVSVVFNIMLDIEKGRQEVLRYSEIGKPELASRL